MIGGILLFLYFKRLVAKVSLFELNSFKSDLQQDLEKQVLLNYVVISMI